MFRLSIIPILILLFAGCDDSRIFETNHDFTIGEWPSTDTVSFNIDIPDSVGVYNVLVNVRNTIDFNTARIFIQYELSDSSAVLRNRMLEQNLFNKKTGEPYGESGLRYIYFHQFLVEPKIKFPHKGTYQVKLYHMMRYDTLPEIRSVGVRVEKAAK